MNVFIMTDMEGVCGVQDIRAWTEPGGARYEDGRMLLTREVNAAVEGFVAGGAERIVVADGHGAGGIDHLMLHPAAEYARNWVGPYPFGLDDGHFDFIAWVGQHPKAGTVRGHLCHTGWMGVRESTVNGISMGEFGEMAVCAWELGVRAIFASGCEAFAAEARELVPGIETVAVKHGLQTDPGHSLPADAYERHNIAAIHLSVERARALIQQGAQKAIERARREDFGLVRIPPPYRREIVNRATATSPPMVHVQEHPTSVIAMLNAPGSMRTVNVDPMGVVGDS